MTANTMLKRVGARTQPCFTPFVTGNESEVSSLSRTVTLIPSCIRRTRVVNFLGQPDFFHYQPLPVSTDSDKRLVVRWLSEIIVTGRTKAPTFA